MCVHEIVHHHCLLDITLWVCGCARVQVGNDAAATRWLERLDDQLVAKGARFDIVDKKTSADMHGQSFEALVQSSIND